MTDSKLTHTCANCGCTIEVTAEEEAEALAEKDDLFAVELRRRKTDRSAG